MIQQNSKFDALNFDTHPSAGSYDTITVGVDFEQIVSGYAQAYAHELHRRNPLRYEASSLTEQSLDFYFRYLLWLRLKSIHDNCKEFRLARALQVPDWIAFILDKLGEAFYPNMGLHIIPKEPEDEEVIKLLKTDKADEWSLEFTQRKASDPKLSRNKALFEDARLISDQLRMFKLDGVGMSDNALPRTKDGDQDVMSSMLIGDYVKSIKEVTPIKTYVSAFLGLNLLGETTWESLFRIRYDDIDYIRSRLISEESIF